MSIHKSFVAYFIHKISLFNFYKFYANVEHVKNWANKTRLDSIHSRRRSPSEEKKMGKKSLKDQKRKNRRSIPQCLVGIISELAFLFLPKYLKFWFHKIFDQGKEWNAEEISRENARL